MARIEDQILSNLITNEEYARKVIPFLDEAYFQDKHEKVILSEIVDFFSKYNTTITKDILRVQLSNNDSVNDTGLSVASKLVDEYSTEKSNESWLVEQTENFCKEKSVYNAIIKSIKIIDGDDDKLTQNAIPGLLSTALSVSFNTQIGHELLEDAEQRWNFYNAKEEKIAFDLKMMNKITKGGMSNGNLYCVGAQSGGGKSLFMSHVAAGALRQGKNVLYITLEMAEEKIAQRIDANLMRVNIDALSTMTKNEFMTKVDKIKSKTNGKLFVKQYPTSSAHVGHFRALFEELKIKKGFVADLVIVDYLGICASSRMKMGGSVNSYTYVKSIAEELRGLAVEYSVPILTGAQLNRSGFGNSEVELDNTADSMGIVMTLDVFFALIRTEELDAQGTILVKQLKNREADLDVDKRFLLGIDKSRMTFFDVAESTQHSSITPQAKNVPDVPLFDKSKSRDVTGFKF